MVGLRWSTFQGVDYIPSGVLVLVRDVVSGFGGFCYGCGMIWDGWGLHWETTGSAAYMFSLSLALISARLACWFGLEDRHHLHHRLGSAFVPRASSRLVFMYMKRYGQLVFGFAIATST